MEFISNRPVLVVLMGCMLAAPLVASEEDGSPSQLDGTEILAIVGDQHVLRGDVMPRVRMVMQPVLVKMSAEERYLQRKEIAQQESMLLQQMVMQAVETKLLYMAFLQSLTPEQRATAHETIDAKVEEMFENAVLEMLDKIAVADKKKTRELFRSAPQVAQLARLMNIAGIDTIAELDQQLRPFQTSVELERGAFKEENLGRSYLGDRIRKRPEINHREMLEYYRVNQVNYEIESAARWEQLSVYFEEFDSREDAYSAIVQMGNEVLRGAKLKAIAQRSSQESRAAQGGLHEWTVQGSLVSEPLDQAVFNLPSDKLSRIIEDDRGFHIIRVLERREAGRVSFQDAQKEIKEKLRVRKQQEQIEKLLKELRDAIPIWTVYDDG
ncbi:MAG: peptidylprolyl isomerase [Planctomycetota bacterium]|nr:peptidylprolyl isomerase [Planctomycetota bacterium]MEE2990226.1 peptidylprolyl isomerase [Planctomycetota bacterium]